MTQIKNLTKKTILHNSPTFAISSFDQAKGFMFSRPKMRAIIFVFNPPRIVSLHMWFVFGAIDVIGLDSNYVVVAKKENFKPWKFWNSKLEVNYVVELPVGTINNSKTCIGDVLKLD